MAPTYVRDTGLKTATGFNGTTTGSFASLPAVGNHVIVGSALYNSAGAGMANVTDNQSNSYSEDKDNVTNTSNGASIWSTKVITSSGTYTITIEPDNFSENYAAWSAVEFSGLAATSHLDQSGSNAGTSSTDANVTASGANTTASGVAIGVAGISGSDTDLNIGDTPPSGYTNIQVCENVNSIKGYSMVYKIYSSSETSAAQWSHDNDAMSTWTAVIATYKESAGALSVNKSESITLSESVTVTLPNALAINVTDSTTVSENASASLPGGTLQVSVSDTVTVQEAVGVRTNIYFVSSQITDVSVATASPAVTAPAGIQDGDVILIFGATNTNANVAASAGGFTRVGTEVDTGSDASTFVLYKVASGEGASWTLTNLFDATEIGRFVALVYRNVNASPINTSNQADAGTVTTVQGPSITPTVSNTMVLQMIGTDPGTGAYAATPDTDPVGTERADGKDASSNAYVAIQEYLQYVANSVALDFTSLTSDTYGSHQLALNPKVEIFKAETVTVSESVQVQLGSVVLTISVSDTINVSEAVAASLPDALQVSKSESITVTENHGELVTSYINKSETITTSESVGLLELSSISVSDTVTVSESKAAAVSSPQISVTDSTTLSETVSVNAGSLPTLEVSVSDSVTVTESQSLTVALQINVSDTVTASESRNVATGSLAASAADSITVTESAQTTIVALGTYTVSVSDAVTLSESVSAATGSPQISKSETITVSESVTLATGALQVSKSETITVSESVSAAVQVIDVLNVAVSDTVTITEAIAAAVSSPAVTVSDQVTVSEVVSVGSSALQVTVTDSISLAESISAVLPDPILINVSDMISVVDLRQVFVPGSVALGIATLSNSLYDIAALNLSAPDLAALQDVAREKALVEDDPL